METFKTATLNICGLGDKISDLIELMEKNNITILGIADVRKKGNNIQKILKDYVLIWSGVSKSERARHGVGFVMHQKKAKLITNVDYISERIIRVQLMERERTITLIQVYAPCNDNSNETERNEFYEKLSTVVNTVNHKDDLFIMGDFNGRLGPKRAQSEHCLGYFGDTTTERNSNGEELINLCLEHGLVITNTFYQHRPSHIKTWYKWNNLLQASQIDFILVRNRQKRNITDARVVPNINTDTDHRPVVIVEKIEMVQRQNKYKETKHWQEPVLNLRKLEEEATREKLYQGMSQVFSTIPNTIGNVQKEWEFFKTNMLENLKDVCGARSPMKTYHKTAWWNDEIHKLTQLKKECFRTWLKSKDQCDYVKYRLARRSVKRKVREAKDNAWCRYGEHLTNLCVTNPRDFFKSVNSMRARDETFNPTIIINSRNGTPILNPSDIKARWKEYFQELYNPNPGNITENVFRAEAQETLEPDILSQEIETAINNSPRNKSPGADGIPNEAIKACKDIGVKWLARIFTAAWAERKVPEDWQKAVVVPLWKGKGNKRDCDSYRGISLLCHTGKMYAKILEQRARHIVDFQLSPAQFGFRRSVGCTDALFTLRQLSERTIEYNEELNVLFVDQEKAFDRVNRNKLWETLQYYGVRGQLLDNIRAFYENCRNVVRTTDGVTETFETTTGVRQGCVLSPLLFNIYMDRVVKETQNINTLNSDNEEDEDHLNNSLNELLFADDQCLIYKDEEAIQHHINSLLTTCSKYNMKINTKKTEIMKISKSPSPSNINIDNTKVKEVSEFKYLGSIFSNDGRLDREIETRCQKANAVTYQLSPLLLHPKIKMEVKRQMIKSIFLPTLCYQCQTWSLTSAHQRKLTTCEMKCLRKAVGVTRLDRITNEEIRKRVGIISCNKYIESQQIQWFGHLMRMNNNQLPVRAFNQRRSGYRAKGRPRKRWIDNIKETLNSHGLNATEATHLALDRKLKLLPLRSTASVDQ